MELRWVVSSRASGFHAAAALVRGQPTAHAELAAALAESAKAIGDALSLAGAASESAWEHLVPLSAGIESNRSLADVVLRKTVGGEHTSEPLVAACGDLLRAQDRVLPKLLDELELRARPLAEQWEARGPGLLAGVARAIEPGILVENADILLVHPICGGGGQAHPSYNSVRLEAVLANPVAELPEIVRLGWLLVMLQLDLPKYSENLQRPRRVLPLAMIPPTLAAAGDVELLDPAAALPRAVATWIPGRPAGPKVAETLSIWWQTYTDTRPPWGMALLALEKMLDAP